MQDVGTIDWYAYMCFWERFDAASKRVAELVGVSERFLAKAVRGKILMSSEQQRKALNVHKRCDIITVFSALYFTVLYCTVLDNCKIRYFVRFCFSFYTTMILNELVNEVPLCEVAQKFNCSRGVLQSLQQAAATFAGQHRDACLVLRHNAPCVHCLLFCRHGDGVLSASGLAQSGAASDAVSVAINVRSSATTCRSCASVARQWTASARAVQRRIPNRGQSGAS